MNKLINNILSDSNHCKQDVVLAYNFNCFVVYFKQSQKCLYIPTPETNTDDLSRYALPYLKFRRKNQWHVALQIIFQQNNTVFCSKETQLFLQQNSFSTCYIHKLQSLTEIEELYFNKYVFSEHFTNFYNQVKKPQNYSAVLDQRGDFWIDLETVNLKKFNTRGGGDCDLDFTMVFQINKPNHKDIDIFKTIKKENTTIKDLLPMSNVIRVNALHVYHPLPYKEILKPCFHSVEDEYDFPKYDRDSLLDKPLSEQTKEELQFLKNKIQQEIMVEFYESQEYLDLVDRVLTETGCNNPILRTKYYDKEDNILYLWGYLELLFDDNTLIIQTSCRTFSGLSKRVSSKLCSTCPLSNKNIFVWNNNRNGIFTLFRVSGKLPLLTLYNYNRSRKPIEVYIKENNQEKLIEVLPTKKETYQKYKITRDRLDKCINTGVSHNNFFFREKNFTPDIII